ncbi:hypothetical protein DFH27DRAFT_578031 [Peziza echinospora]|nr:hypothetical protein DFH27DRAFT_578031 [Peziza echinospora]
MPTSIDFNHIKHDATDTEIQEALASINNTNVNPDTIFASNQYSYSTTQMRVNQLPDWNLDIDQGHTRGTYRDFERIPCRWDQVKIGLFTTPINSWVKQNKKNEEGTAYWETAWKRDFDLGWDWNDRQWEGINGQSGCIAGQQSFFNHWNGVPNKSGGRGRKLASIHNVWAGGDGGGRGDCLRQSLEFMQKVALGEVNLRGDPTAFGFKVVK